MTGGSSSAQKSSFKDTLLLFLMYLHTHAIKLLYKCTITIIATRLPMAESEQSNYSNEVI